MEDDFEIEDNEPFRTVSKKERKAKRQRSKELRSALKSKTKVAGFMERARQENDDEDISEIEHIENLYVSNGDDEIDDGSSCVQLKHTTEFEPGVEYRKLSCNSILVSMEPFRIAYFTGKCLIQVLKGSVSIYGFTINPDGKQYATFSAKGHTSLLFISSLSRTSPINYPTSYLTSLGLSLEEVESFPGAVIVLSGFENEWCDGIRNTYPEFSTIISPSMSGVGPGRLPPRKNFLAKLGFNFVSTSNLDKLHGLEFPPYFDNVFNDLTSQFNCSTGRICPFGGKGVGKSTFVKWVINRFLSVKSSVLFIDLDPGQTEFTPPGMISVHLITDPCLGPNFAHLRDPRKAVFIGGVSVADVPITYIKAVADLFEYCQSSEFQNMPWIINTMGFSQGLGVHLACEIIKIFRPHCVIQLNIENDRRSFPFLLNQENVTNYKTYLSRQLPRKYSEPLENYHFLAVKSAVNRSHKANQDVWGASPKVCREMVLISYFSEIIGSAEGFDLRAVFPLKVPLDSVAIGTIRSSLNYNGILSSINGNLVALCEMPANTFQSVVTAPKRKYITNAGDYSNNCIGYGIVRAIDANTIYIITPVARTDLLSKVSVILCAGGVGLPLQFYVNGSDQNLKPRPYVMGREDGTSTLHAPTKRFFVPKRVTHTVLQNCLL